MFPALRFDDPGRLTLLLRCAVAACLPTIACFGYYTMEKLGNDNPPWSVVAVLAYPAAIVGLIGIAATLLSRRRSHSMLLVASACLTLPAIFVLLLT